MRSGIIYAAFRTLIFIKTIDVSFSPFSSVKEKKHIEEEVEVATKHLYSTVIPKCAR